MKSSTLLALCLTAVGTLATGRPLFEPTDEWQVVADDQEIPPGELSPCKHPMYW
jgi:hypothetical protein